LYLFSGGEFYFSKFSEVGQERLELKSGSPGYAQIWDAVTKAIGLYKTLNLPNAERGFNLRVLRDAIIDLSGFSLRAGIKIHL